MKKIFTLIVCAIVLASCGGGGAGVNSNATIGNLPSIFADWDLATEQLKADENNASSMDDLVKLDKERKEVKEKYSTMVDAEIEALLGKEIKFMMSQALKSSTDVLYTITVAPKITPSAAISASFTPVANQPITVTTANQYDHVVYGKMVNSMGEALHAFKTSLLGTLGGKTIEKGGPLSELQIPFQGLSSRPIMWADFDQIVFCTKEEYEQAEKDAETARRNEYDNKTKK